MKAEAKPEKREEISWRQHGKLKVGVTPSGRVVVKCPQCSRNIKIDKEEIPSIVRK